MIEGNIVVALVLDGLPEFARSCIPSSEPFQGPSPALKAKLKENIHEESYSANFEPSSRSFKYGNKLVFNTLLDGMQEIFS
jgi:hypothetical protein